METERRVLSLVRQPRGVEHEAEVALLYRALHATLRRYAVRLVDRDDADDVVQDAMLKYLAQREREGKALAPDDARLRLLSMVKDAARDRLRRSRRESRLMQLITGPTAAVRRWMSARRPADDGAIREAIHEALGQLPSYTREPWLLVREQGLSVDEAAALLEVTPDSCRALISKANRELRRLLSRQGFTPHSLRGRDDA